MQHNNLMVLLPKVLNVEGENFKMTPSEFIKEMNMTTDERHKKQVHTATAMKACHVEHPPQFVVLPNILLFQKFEARQSLSLTLEVKNVGKTLLPLKMHCPDSAHFSAQHVGTPVNKLAPGLSAEYKITFTPKEAKDYTHHLVFRSREDTFRVPIAAVGPRAVLDIPDRIVVEPAPVKIARNKIIVVRNIGDAPAVFNLLLHSDHFRVSPSKGVLQVHESMLLSISFEASRAGDVTESLHLLLESGEKLEIVLHGSAENVGVRLEKNSVSHEDTFVGLKRCKVVRLINSSSSVVKFSWKKSICEDEDVAERMKEKYEEITEREIRRDAKVKFHELSDPKGHEQSWKRILKDELRSLARADANYTHEAFEIVPESGEAWPKTSAEIMVSFEPKTCGPVSSTAYLEVTGRDARLPLRIKGCGLGPKIVLSVKTLDIDYIYLCSLHKYEVLAENKGDIPGSIEYVPATLIFGGRVEVTPESRRLEPKECAAFVISFTSNRQGDFTEKLTFAIKESGDSVPLVLKGKILSPTLHFDNRQVDFGIIPVGFPEVREVTLSNLSMVPVTFSLRVLSDGEIPSLSYKQFATFAMKPALPQSPKEFQIDPQESVVEPFSSKQVTVTLTANRAGQFLTSLVADMWDSETGSISCPIRFRPQIASLAADPKVIMIPFCFINFPYTRSITLRNSSRVAGFFYIVPSDPNPESPMTCSASTPQGVIQPRGSTTVDVTVMTSAVGRQVVPIRLMTFGYEFPREVCVISCVGQGPVVTVTPSNLNWGDLPLLQEFQRTLALSNESPIPAAVTIFLENSKSPWAVDPAVITLAPEKSVEVTISLLLKDRGKFRDILNINVHNGKVLHLLLSATGIGSSLRIVPDIKPKYDLGTLFSHKKYEFEISVENSGTKPHSLVWSPFPDFKTFASLKFVYPQEQVFKIEPSKMEVLCGDKKTMSLVVQSASMGLFLQTLYCFASIGGPARELHLTAEIRAEFVEPLISFDKSRVEYWYNVGSDEKEEKLEDQVLVTNSSVLPISVEFSAGHPFFLENEKGEFCHGFEMSLDGNESKSLTVRFRAERSADKRSRTFEESLQVSFKEHSKKCSVSLRGEINYPNVVVLPGTVDFGHVPVGTEACREILLVNVSPLNVYYQAKWKTSASTVSYWEKSSAVLEESPRFPEESGDRENESENAESFDDESAERSEKGRPKDELAEAPPEPVPPSKPIPRMPEIAVSASDVKSALFPFARGHHRWDDEFSDAYKLAAAYDADGDEPAPGCLRVCDITPFYGRLEPFSSQILAVKFSPDAPVDARVEAVLSVVAGPAEVITIRGKSGEIAFELSAVDFDFGKQLFCQAKSQILKIRNTGAMPFAYEAVTEGSEACRTAEEAPPEHGTLGVTPRAGRVNSYSVAELSVTYHPGVPGKFEREFRLQVAHLEPIPVTVRGFGVFPQVHVVLPRPGILEIPPEVGYSAVASVSPDWLATGFAASCSYNSYSVKPYRSQESNLDRFSEEEESELNRDGWEIFKTMDPLPSEVDVQLAIERRLALDLIDKDRSRDSAFAFYARTIPQFYVPAYEIDFEVAVVGRTTKQNVMVTNQGPLPAVVYAVFESSLKEEGIQVRLKNRNEIKVGGCLSFAVSFCPKKSKYKKRVRDVRGLFHFEVYHGPKIPIGVLARVTYPHLITSAALLDYSRVVCGCCKIMNLKLRNPGLVTAFWSLAILGKCSGNDRGELPRGSEDGSPMFHANQSLGFLEPEQCCSVQLTFKPEYEACFAAVLRIEVTESLEETKVVLLGEGLEPRLSISHHTLEFRPTTPYPHGADRVLVVANPCSFPIEFYFPTFDEQIFEEDKILRAIASFYGTKEILMPVRRPGDGLPVEFVSFYQALLEDLNARFLEAERERSESCEENASCVLYGEDESTASAGQAGLSDKKRRKLGKTVSRSRTSADARRVLSATLDGPRDPNPQSVFERKTSEEIEEMLNDYIRSIASEDPSRDPVQAAVKRVVPPPEEEEYRRGTLVVFHGAPFTNSAQLANRAALTAGVAVSSIDRIVLEEAALARSPAGLAVRELIEQAYRDHVEGPTEGGRWTEPEEHGENDFKFVDEFGEIQRKFNAVLAMRESLIAAKAPPTSSAKSDGFKKLEKDAAPNAKSMNPNAPVADVTEELVLEVLKSRLSVEVIEGMVIEGLQSVFIGGCVNALLALLRAAGNIEDILVVFLLNSYASYMRYVSNVQAEQESERCKTREEALTVLEEEPEEVFLALTLNPEEEEQIRSAFAAQRREGHVAFERKKEAFYEMQKLKREALRNGSPVPALPLSARFEASAEKSQKEKREKEKKKDAKEAKVVKTSDASGRSESETKSVKNKRDSKEEEFLAFESELAEMKAVVESWDQRIGAPVVDAAPDAKTRKGLTPRKTEVQSANRQRSARGAFLWLADVSDPEANGFPAVCCQLRTALLELRVGAESDACPPDPTESMSFSVAVCPPPRAKSAPSDVFTFSATEPPLLGEDAADDVPDQASSSSLFGARLNGSASQTSRSKRKGQPLPSKRRGTDSRSTTDVKNVRSKRSASGGAPECSWQTKFRWVLQPGESISYRVRYFPVEAGKSEQIFPINVVNWENGYAVRCVGTCDVPAVDVTPEVLFPAVADLRPSAGPESPAYFYSENAYDFGSVIAQGSEGKGSAKTTFFNLVNKSALPVDLTAVLAQDAAGDARTNPAHVKFHPDKVFLLPGERQLLCVSASPLKCESVQEILMIFVKDNPRVESIRVQCEGVRANVTVEPKTVDFDRILLHRQDFRRVAFTNNNSIPLFVLLKGIENLPPQFCFSAVAGWIAAFGVLVFEIRYSATEVQSVSDQALQVQVFDSLEAEEPVQEFPIGVSVEAYDVALDVIFSVKDDDHVDFGKIRVENNHANVFTLRNAGKYQLGFRVRLEELLLAESGNDQFFVSPQEGKLLPGKPVSLTVNFAARNEVSWKRLPLLKLELLDPNGEDELVATIPIEVSAESFFARYEIKPSSELNFGALLAGSATTGSLLIENKGCFPLSYSIEQRSAGEGRDAGDEESPSRPNVSSKDGGDKGDKGKKPPPPPPSSSSTTGVFEICPRSGVAEVGETAVVRITCRPDEAKSYEERVTIFVGESPPHLKKGTRIDVFARGCLPTVDFRDFKTVFREHLVVRKASELERRPEFGSRTVFAEDEASFAFENVCLCKTEEARLELPNSGLIECRLTASVCAAEGKEADDSAVPEGERFFDVFPKTLVIEPYASATLTVAFRPEALAVYKARLRMILEMPEGYEDVEEAIDLRGNGILPQIEITEPDSKLPRGEALVNFPRTSPGHRSTSAIAFSNVGPTDCKVILELYKCEIGVFTLTPRPGTEKMLRTWELGRPIDHTAVVAVSPGQAAEFVVTFGPRELKSYSSEIKLFVVDNPFENWRYRLVGDVFFEEVVIEKIRRRIPFLQEDADAVECLPGAPGQYQLNFGDCFVKKKSKALLRLANKTEKDHFRFEWDEEQGVAVSPSTGHLYPNSYKEILFVFHPEEPVELREVSMVCTLNKIRLRNPPEISWDSRLVVRQRFPDAETLPSPASVERRSSPQRPSPDAPKAGVEEPEFEAVPESERTLVVRVSATADLARLRCEKTKIAFKNTFTFQSRVYPLILENCGNVELEYKLTLRSVAAWPLRENKTSQVGESLLKVDRSRSRPRSSCPTPSERSGCSTTRAGPIASASLLDLRNLPSEPGIEGASPAPQAGRPAAHNPFLVGNPSGRIAAKEKVSCDITFSPMDANEYRAVIGIQVPNLHPECSLPEIEVTASSLLPHCHFDVPESDYLESGRRDCSRPGPVGHAPGIPLHPDTKCIEIKVLGVGVTTPVAFHAINPTEDDYEFSWTNVSQVQPDVVPSFHCSTVDGRIQAGKQLLMRFHFFSQKIGIAESFWKFSIPKYGVEVPFLLVGDVREPAVYFLKSHINLRPTFVGSSSSDVLTLVNHEETPADFRFLPESLHSEGGLNSVKVEPVAGTVPPRSETDIRVTFTGKTEGKIIFRPKCKVKCVEEAFAVSVEAVTYTVQPLVSFEDLKKTRRFADPAAENVIDFGSELCPHRPETVTLTLTSLSRTSFCYEWEFEGKLLESKSCKMRFSMKSGHVTSFSRAKCDLTLVFYKKSSLTDFPVKLKIRRGPTFNFKINASASTPLCEFSFVEHDFGYCFVQENSIPFDEVVLFLRNKDDVDAVLECQLRESSAFSFALPGAVVPPDEEMGIPIYFCPRERIPYKDALRFTINGVHERVVTLTGHGCDFRVSLADPSDTTVSLGAVRAGKVSRRRFSLVNNGLASATVLVGFSDQLPVGGPRLAKPLENLVDLSRGHRLSGTLSMSPSTAFTLKPRQTRAIEVSYTPQSRSPLFSETVSIQFRERVEPLCILTGCCLGPEIALDRNVLNFGAVLAGCSSALKLKLLNSGNIGAKFEWSPEASGEEYSISPDSGYLSPESSVTVQVTFSPRVVQNCIEKKAECRLLLAENEAHPSLYLSLIGDCVDVPEASEVVSFECRVRGNDVKTLEIRNSSGREWQLMPSISGEYFGGFEALVVPPLSAARYDVTYRPLTMTQGGDFHEGTAFFRLPNGLGILHELRGTSLPPEPEDVIVRDVPCKTKYVELLKIRNWLQYPQRFKTSISCVSGDGQDDPVWSCTGLENFELPALGEKEYGLNFFAYNVGPLAFQVSFANEETKEYLWYDVTFNVVACEALEVITLKGGVRQSCRHHLKLENPLDKTIQYKLESTSPEIHFESSIYDVPPKQSISVGFCFVPIRARERSERLIVTCPELGDFPRDLRLLSVEVQPDPPRTFETPLGASETREIHVENVSRSTAVLHCRTDSGDFRASEQGTAAAGQSARILVTYEPSELGSTVANLFVESEQAGNFTYPLLGICVKPKPKGPFLMKQGSGVTVPFKNPFKKMKEFHMYVDNPAFVLTSTAESIPPKEESNIYVASAKAKRKEKGVESRFPSTGQLVVECFNPRVKWQFYLKALPER